ncbi:MAG: type II toxin-antitoxin system HicB family antitoxin [Deltaproteobacteria bacterium]|nr:type II toxin-antitoxin system HicB family antitoxin [Deltaproteobacteria bacterium]
MKTFVLRVDLKEEEDGRWSASIPTLPGCSSIPTLPGCSSWGYSRQDALMNIKDAAEIYIEDMVDAGEGLPTSSDKIEVINEPAIAVSL